MTVSEKTRHMGLLVKVELRPTVHFAVEIQRFACNRATPLIIEKLWSKGVAMHAYGVSAYYARSGNRLIGPGRSRLK